jgi:DNA-3-methyladenine glycosylase II
MKTTTVPLTPVPPYDFYLTAAAAVNFRVQHGANFFNGTYFKKLLNLNGQTYFTKVHSTGTINHPQLKIEITGTTINDQSIGAVIERLSWILDTNTDLSPFYQTVTQSPSLVPLINNLKGLHINHTNSVFEGLVLAILGQQINSKMARTFGYHLIETYGQIIKMGGDVYYGFPKATTLAAVGINGLKAIKLNRQKADYIANIAHAVASNQLDLENLHNKSDEELVSSLLNIRGVGSWTAQWLLVTSFGRNDGFPHNDLALIRALTILLGEKELLKPEQILKHSQRWIPFRSYVTTYIFAAIRSGRLNSLRC